MINVLKYFLVYIKSINMNNLVSYEKYIPSSNRNSAVKYYIFCY